MKTKAVIFAAIMCMATLSDANATRTIGVPDCGKWVNSRAASGWEGQVNVAWLMGFLTGLNTDQTEYKNGLSKISSGEQILVWTDNYCKAHPLDDLFKAGDELMIELKNK